MLDSFDPLLDVEKGVLTKTFQYATNKSSLSNEIISKTYDKTTQLLCI